MKARKRADTTVRKIMLLGEIGVGKTSLANRLAFDRFEASYKPTLGVELYTADIDVDGTPHRLVLWDTDGDLQERMVASDYCRGASGACVIGDLSRPMTLQVGRDIRNLFGELFPGRPTRLLANKLDLMPGTERIKDATRISVKDGKGVTEALRAVARECWEAAL